jgi:Rieske Fe-S protein
METNESRNGTQPEPAHVSRRKLLGWLVGIINFGVASAIVGPTLGFIGAPLKRKKENAIWIPVLKEEELAEGATCSVNYQLDVEDGYMTSPRTYSVYLHRKGGKVFAYDPSCPHLGCHVEFKARKKRYVCPCHGGVFDEDGNRVSGPPPRGLTQIATKVEGGRLWVRKV